MNHCIRGTVTKVSATGDLITDISNESVADAPGDETVSVAVGDHETLGIFSADHDQPLATMVATRGQQGNLEIGIVGVNMSEMLGIGVGEGVVVKW